MLFAGVFCILLVPFLLKPLAIFLIMISSISAYFMQTYGVIIDKSMLLNSLHICSACKDYYGGFKSALRSRIKIALSTLASAAIIFALMPKIFIPFLENITPQAFYSHTILSTLA